ncbi:hypothetical protein DL96DRAFT_1636397 [Flagelloscypha sp. PMI_526]|nr:hypothetical protein DL96DRAFT_1636397 [Flagelloscypha sp. PMI_526]
MTSLGTFIIALAVFISTTLYWALLFNLNISFLQVAFVDNPGEPLATNLKNTNGSKSSAIFSATEIWLQSVNFFLADAVLVFRAWVIVPYPQYYKMINVVFLIMSGAAALIACVSRMFQSTNEDEVSTIYTVWSRAQLAGWILSLLCNVLGTGLIGHRAWSFYRQSGIQGRLKNQGNTSLIGDTLSLLVESGALYIVLQITFIALQRAPRKSSLDARVGAANIAAQALLSCCIVLSGVFPISTLCIVALKHSIADRQLMQSSEGSLSNPRATVELSRLQFSSSPAPHQ